MKGEAPPKPSDHAERALVAAILDGQYPPGSVLPGERDLAARLGVTRPPLREAIQRLARDGWFEVAQGKPTRVNDFWAVGGLNVLGKLVQNESHLPPDFVTQLLEVRYHLAPAYTRAAVANAAAEVMDFLGPAADLKDEAAAYARYDWLLHHKLTVCSGNPIYTLILNGFKGFYESVARQYFASPATRAASSAFYQQLASLAGAGDPEAAEALCRRVMRASIQAWENNADTKLLEGE
jgi:GntR family negative regulator for fad regulon and positive regulator of fabA